MLLVLFPVLCVSMDSLLFFVTSPLFWYAGFLFWIKHPFRARCFVPDMVTQVVVPSFSGAGDLLSRYELLAVLRFVFRAFPLSTRSLRGFFDFFGFDGCVLFFFFVFECVCFFL